MTAPEKGVATGGVCLFWFLLGVDVIDGPNWTGVGTVWNPVTIKITKIYQKYTE